MAGKRKGSGKTETALESIPAILLRRASDHPDRVALRVKRHGRYHNISWGEYGKSVCEFAAGLLALGLERGETVALWMSNCPEFAYSDLGILIAGGISVAIYTNTTPQGLAYILNHSEARFLIVDSAERFDKLGEISADLGHLKHVVLLERWKSMRKTADINMYRFDEVEAMGRDSIASDVKLIARSMENLKLDETAILIYTSGTTGPPKGAMLSHKNISFICKTTSDVSPHLKEHETFISYLPLAHALERIGCLYFSIYNGGTTGFAERLETVAEDILEIRPTVLIGVPRFFEKIYNGVLASVEKGGMVKKKIFQWAVRVGRQASKRKLKGKTLGPVLRIKYWIADRLVFKKLRERLGGRVKHIVSGGAPLSASISEFFYSVGLPVMEAYGATETSAPATVTRPESLRFGTVGRALPGVDVKIAEDGEIMIRGDGVCKGYFKDNEASARSFVDGWYYTGDIGRFDEEGNLVITDRKKDLIITSAGKNIAPQNIENLLKSSPYINQAMVHGDKRKYLTALVTLNPETIAAFADKEGLSSKGIPELAKEPKIFKLIEQEVKAKNKELASYEQIKKFAVLTEDFSVENGDLTPTLKVRRKVVTEKYKELLDSFYEKEFVSSLTN
jgi:long-chain acyl-CoA synthetase